MAINRANNAIHQVLELRRQWITRLEQLRGELEELREQRTALSRSLDEALDDLVYLQGDYQFHKDVLPESLWDTNYGTKLDDVQNFSFKHLQEQIPADEKFPLEDALEEALDNEYLKEPFIDTLAELEEAEAFDLPKGYGRD
jgi:hypothetical protein